MSLTLALIKIKDCWQKNFPGSNSCTDPVKNALHFAILELEKRYHRQVEEINNPCDKTKILPNVTQANANLCCIIDEILETISELSRLLGCEPAGQTKPGGQKKTVNKSARPGVVNIRPSKQGSYETNILNETIK
jgi:hypothetical protein